ncbi:hypothetical protein QMK19_03520 [Streptomyces sp. H10-C2]|uniref:hypothetical protein n=1 Tax=unclassified Streptomyces TaxID=2593676 RepID=UPI0024BB77C4|nr:MULTISPECIES: hypothetical protein [unclassified Streptomyces]MDJ0342256.1 hypothetical protein [Streptomyces sp. PH10-H1]MDJ0368770.1 hypothetical protein [Streptomyces sp. H10-C2]
MGLFSPKYPPGASPEDVRKADANRETEAQHAEYMAKVRADDKARAAITAARDARIQAARDRCRYRNHGTCISH